MIASSGLEHCVKIWTPNLEDETQLSDLSEIVEKNASRDSLSHDVLTIFLSVCTVLLCAWYVTGMFPGILCKWFLFCASTTSTTSTRLCTNKV